MVGPRGYSHLLLGPVGRTVSEIRRVAAEDDVQIRIYTVLQIFARRVL